MAIDDFTGSGALAAGGTRDFRGTANGGAVLTPHSILAVSPNTTLSAAIVSTGATSITVTSAAGFPTSGNYNIVIDNEVLTVTAGQGTTTWTVTRGVNGTTAATHLISAVTSQYPTPVSAGRGAGDIGTQRITQASDDALPVAFGAQADTSATTDTGTFSLMALIKRLLSGIQGRAASGAALAGNPVRIGASDGTNAVDARIGTSTTNGGASIAAVVVRPFVATDGTNVAPTMDAAARAGFFKMTDGTNLQPTMDAAARRGFVTHTDGTNSMPTGDAAARAIYHRVTDGTNQAAVKAASTAPVAADPALVVAVSPNTPTIGVAVKPATSGGAAPYRVMSAATTNGAAIKASAGQIYGWYLFNNSSASKFVKFYNKASAPTVGTDTPAFTLTIPAGSGSNIPWDTGIPFATGIAIAITGAVADTDTTATAVNDVTGFVSYA